MDYGKVLKRAWEITWKWKVLWILGFLAALGSGSGGGGGGNFGPRNMGETDLGRFTRDLSPDFWIGVAWAILALIVFFLILAIIVWVVSIIARGGLIAGVQQVEDEGSTSFRQAWRAGRSRFWTLLGIGVLSALPFIVIGLAFLVAGLWAFFAVGAAASAAGGDFGEAFGALAAPGIIAAACCGAALCCGMILLGIVLDQIRIYAERAAVLDGLGWIDAFKLGWQVIKDNLGPTIIFWLIFLVIGFMIAAIVIAIMAAAAVPLIVLFVNVEPGWWMVAPACLGGLLGIILFALIGAIVETFTSTTWTLVYRELTGVEAGGDEAPAELELDLDPDLEGAAAS